MPAVPIHYLDVRAFCYATEDESRVEMAIRTLLPEDASIERDTSEGHYGDRILVMHARLERADEIRHVLGLLREMPTFDRVHTEIEERMDEDCAFFLRLDKQRAYQGEVALGHGIQLRGKIEAYPASREAAIENLRSYLEATS